MTEKNDFTLSPVFCLHNGAVILSRDESSVKFGLLNEDDETLKRRLENAVTSKLNLHDEKCSTFVAIDRDTFNRQISWMFSHDGENPEKKLLNENEDALSENEAAALLDALIGNAVRAYASDIHIEGNVVRYRICGKLCREIELGDERRHAVVQRIKLLASLNVVEHRRPQDGHFVFRSNEKKVFVRVSCLPTVGSFSGEEESIVLRLLDPDRVPLKLESLGFDERQIPDLKKMCTMENGLILICGATGSGKSTTAGAMLEEIRKNSGDSKKIISLEDPPEYVLEGVSQVQIQDCHGLGFAEILRRTFRQDPDVIFIGEIRDGETAEIAVQAALTGHLVFATLHTGTISQAVLRMYDLGASPKLVNAVLSGIIVQKLVEGKLSARIQVLNPADVSEKSRCSDFE
ncbi:MAG: Flp pilus assembly complex ATPase component TadA [Treponema sp.]|nr:Flp pilus assembly complex ATPase component TadA [Treponema sp.]